MTTVYLLGGQPRTAKSTILSKLAIEQGIPLIATDAIQEGLRNVLVGEPYQMLRAITLEGTAEYKQSIQTGGVLKEFSKQTNEQGLVQETVIGMLDHYARNNLDIALEGSIITPEWVASIPKDEFLIKAAFVGYTKEAHADSVIEYARNQPTDWINDWLSKENGESEVRAWVAEQAIAGQKLKSDAEAFGFTFFDISSLPFNEYIVQAQEHLLH